MGRSSMMRLRSVGWRQVLPDTLDEHGCDTDRGDENGMSVFIDDVAKLARDAPK